MTSASTGKAKSSAGMPAEVDVWLDIGREGLCFTYLDSRFLGADLGDLVLVRLRGRPLNGLVVARRNSQKTSKINEIDEDINFEYN